MYKYISLLLLVALLVIIMYLTSKRVESADKNKYHYKKKTRIITDHEFAFYSILNDSVSDDYYIMVQAHLSAFIDHTVFKQSWKGALSHIDRKSVDYLLCDKQTLAPVLAIELDDRTHEQVDRRVRDVEVERILSEAVVPLLRMESHGSLTTLELKNLVIDKIHQR